MKLVRNDGKFAAKTLSVLGIVAVSALTGSALTYLTLVSQLKTEQVNSDLAEAMSDAGRCNIMLHQLKNGQTRYTTGILNSELAKDAQTISRLSDNASSDVREYSKMVLSVIGKQQKVAPEVKMASTSMESTQ